LKQSRNTGQENKTVIFYIISPKASFQFQAFSGVDIILDESAKRYLIIITLGKSCVLSLLKTIGPQVQSSNPFHIRPVKSISGFAKTAILRPFKTISRQGNITVKVTQAIFQCDLTVI